MFLPGSVFVLLGGYYAESKDINIFLVMFLGFLGMFVGDIVNYYLGKSHWHRQITHKIPGLRSEEKREQIARFLKKRGIVAILYMHFVGSLRSILCFIAGMVGFPLKKYLAASFVASFFWSAFFSIAGYILARTAGDVNSFQKNISAVAIGGLVLFGMIKFVQARLSKKLNAPED
jgi:membrane-associated protein